jgi:6-pyruvoyltetrahydropterin/6-carboxytetrahydropterin synthase
LDHKYLNELDPFNELSPSSENISRYLFYALGERLNNDNVTVEMITVWESDVACASFYEP